TANSKQQTANKNKFRLLIFAILLLFFSGCTEDIYTEDMPDNIPHINGTSDNGNFEDITDFNDPDYVKYNRAMAYLQFNNSDGIPDGACSSIAVSPYHILTAAHCLDNNLNSTPDHFLDFASFGLDYLSTGVECNLIGSNRNINGQGIDCINRHGPGAYGYYEYKGSEGHQTKDYAIIRLKYNLNRYKGVGWIDKDDIGSPNSDLPSAEVFGYGLKYCSMSDIHGGSGYGFGFLRRGWGFEVGGDSGDRFIIDGYRPFLDAETWLCGGDSGGPVFQEDKLIGLFTLGWDEYDNATKINRTWTFDHIDADNDGYDLDGDGFYNYDDNCVDVYNPRQFTFSRVEGENGIACSPNIDGMGASITEMMENINKFSLFGENTVYFNDRAWLIDNGLIGGNYIEIGDGASVGTLLAGNGGIFVRGGSSADGSVLSNGTINVQDESRFHVKGSTVENYQLFSLPTLSFFTPALVNFPVGIAISKNVEPWQAENLSIPKNALYSAYDKVAVKGILRLLNCGTYYFNELTFEPGSSLVMRGDECGQPTKIYVRDKFMFRGVQSAYNEETFNPDNLLFAVFGTSYIPIEREFYGTIIAPDSAVGVSIPTQPHLPVPRMAATIYANTIVIHQGTILDEVLFKGSWLP
ncbi:MAG: hypothetical protein JXR91_12385, partial [Deltaproteobacteria bacterium]|nr:hypothetical protein [Deltaproteobacteria bacterium]